MSRETLTFVCLPFFLKFIEKRVQLINTSGRSTFEYESILLSLSLSNMHSGIETNHLIRQPVNAAAMMTRSSSTKVATMATPMMRRGCIECTWGVTLLPVGSSRWMVVRR